MARRDLADLLGMRLRLHPGCRFEPGEGVLWARRRNPVERLLSLLIPSSGPRVRVALDDPSRRVVGSLVDLQPVTGRDLAEALGIPAGPDAFSRRDPDLVAFLVFLGTLERSGVLVTEPI